MPSRTRSMPLKDDRANPNQFPVKSAALRGRGGSLRHVGLRSSVTWGMRRSRAYLIGWARRKVIGMPLFINLPFSHQNDHRCAWLKSDAFSIIKNMVCITIKMYFISHIPLRTKLIWSTHSLASRGLLAVNCREKLSLLIWRLYSHSSL